MADLCLEPSSATARALRLAVARTCLAGFVPHTSPGYHMGWVHEAICRELDLFLDAVLAEQSPRLMITMPPRHGKSELATRRFPAYALGRHPRLHFIAASYGADLASRMNRDVQRIMDSEAYAELFPQVCIGQTRNPSGGRDRGRAESSGVRRCSAGARRSDFFEIPEYGGSFRSAGVGGGITGMGGSVLIVDDPIKDRAEADSPLIRNKVWDWYTSTLYTRLAPGGGIVLIQTRWHMDDLAGRLLDAAKNGGDQWRVIDFPAIATRDEEHRCQGEALHPERYPLEQLLRIKASLGRRDWQALYQQRPVPDGGAIFHKEWLQYYWPKDLPEHFERMILSWDMAFKESEDADYVVGQVWARQGACCYLLDQVRGRMGFTSTVQAFRDLTAKWPMALEKLVEDKANGPAVMDSLKHQVPGIIAVNPDGSKMARAHAVTPLFEAKNVFIPHPGLYPWVADYEAELLQFPASAHDDQVDATTQALRRLGAGASIIINPAILKAGTIF